MGFQGVIKEREKEREKERKQLNYLPICLDSEKEVVVMFVLDRKQSGVAGHC